MSIWIGLLEGLGEILRFFHDATVGLFGDYSWTVAIILLTVAVRLAMMPLAVRQFRSMRAMQELRPQMKKIQSKYKTDRGMMRTDPEKFREKRQKQQEELMALYKEHNVNPASSCLPLVAQMPIFVALFSMLRSPDVIPELATAPFPIDATLQMPANAAGVIAIGMLLAMGVTTFVQQKQMMGRQAITADDQQMQQQKMMMYIMPVFLVFLGFTLPVGILVYWVTTNVWQMAQQWYMLREVGGGQSNGDQADRSPKNGPSGAAERPQRSARPKRSSGRPDGAGGRKGKGGSSSNGSGGNGYRPGRPGRLGKKRNETRDKRR
ncbi:MAG: YidC/Oxa1 family membrane protein insertase [Actinobacteria bacterium]|nr:YidC/Oxa1 family membrane protein insertase [Actinomycetota bacterium]